jgi:hypothetical protein
VWALRIGGAIMAGGCVLFAITGAIVAGGGAVGLGGGAIGSLALAAGLALLGSGAAVLSLAEQKPLSGRNVQIGLRVLAVGLISVLTSSIIAGTVQSESPLLLLAIVLLVMGIAATLLGGLVTLLALVRARARRGSPDG